MLICHRELLKIYAILIFLLMGIYYRLKIRSFLSTEESDVYRLANLTRIPWPNLPRPSVSKGSEWAQNQWRSTAQSWNSSRGIQKSNDLRQSAWSVVSPRWRSSWISSAPWLLALGWRCRSSFSLTTTTASSSSTQKPLSHIHDPRRDKAW